MYLTGSVRFDRVFFSNRTETETETEMLQTSEPKPTSEGRKPMVQFRFWQSIQVVGFFFPTTNL